MNKTYLFVSLMILAFAAVWLYQKWAVKKAAMKMMEIRQPGSEEEFIQALDSGYAKLSFNDFTGYRILQARSVLINCHRNHETPPSH